MNLKPMNRIPTDDERRMLFRLFSAWTSAAPVAEDLVQQTLIEAWKSTRQPVEPAYKPWLMGIARNVLLRWRRTLSLENQRRVDIPDHLATMEALAGNADVEDTLEHKDMVALLSDVLDALPVETRQAIVLKYLHELPQTAVADELGITVKNLEAKLHRGKKAMRNEVLLRHTDQAIAQGLIREQDAWITTNLTCDACGEHQLLARWGDNGYLRLDCPSCFWTSGERSHLLSGHVPSPTMSFRKIYRAMGESVPSERGLRAQPPACVQCGAPTTGVLESGEHPLLSIGRWDISWLCDTCGVDAGNAWLPGIGLFTPPGIRFYERARTVRMTEPVIVDRLGRQAIQTTWESMSEDSTFTAWIDTETWRLLDWDDEEGER